MKIYLSILLVLVCASFTFGQKSRTVTNRTRLATTATLISGDVKKLTPAQRGKCLEILKKLDGADAEFFINKNSRNYLESIRKIYGYYDSNIDKMPVGKLRNAFALMMLNYVDASVLIHLGETRSENGSVELTDAMKENLGEMQQRYDKLLHIGATGDLLDPDTVTKIFASALDLKTGMKKFFQ